MGTRSAPLLLVYSGKSDWLCRRYSISRSRLKFATSREAFVSCLTSWMDAGVDCSDVMTLTWLFDTRTRMKGIAKAKA